MRTTLDKLIEGLRDYIKGFDGRTLDPEAAIPVRLTEIRAVVEAIGESEQRAFAREWEESFSGGA